MYRHRRACSVVGANSWRNVASSCILLDVMKTSSEHRRESPHPDQDTIEPMGGAIDVLSETARSLVLREFGMPRRIDSVFGRDARHDVRRLCLADGRVVYLKMFRAGRAERQESEAWRRWAPMMDARLRRLASAPGMIVTPEVAGECVASWEWFEGDGLRDGVVDDAKPSDKSSGGHADRLVVIFRAAGHRLARLHAIDERDVDAMTPAEAMRRRFVAASRRLAERTDRSSHATAIVDHVVSTVTRLAAGIESLFDGDDEIRRVPCHRDFGPWNWIWCPQSERLGVIDFEHARLDDPLVDFAKLEAARWWGCPWLRDAFFDGYGGRPRRRDARRLRAHVVLHELATVARSETSETEMVEASARIVERVAELVVAPDDGEDRR